MDWMVPWTSLDNDQRNIIQAIESSTSHCIWVDGFAGSGKTLILLHFIKRFIIKSGRGSICFITYTHALTDLALTAFTRDELSKVNVTTLYDFIKNEDSYDIVVLDEVQDAKSIDLQLVYQKANKLLLIAGDPTQSIYEHGVTKEELFRYNGGKNPLRLKSVYRLTEKIKKVANIICPNSNIIYSSTPTKLNTLKRGSDVYFFEAESKEEEVKFVMSKVLDYIAPGKPCAILFPHHYAIKEFCSIYIDQIGLDFDIVNNGERLDYEKFNEFCIENNLKINYFGNKIGSLNLSDRMAMTYLMTYHSAKGLDFDTVMIPFFDDEIVRRILYKMSLADPEMPNRLLYVAATRSRFDLIFSYHTKKPYKLLVDLKNKGLISKMVNKKKFNSDHDFDDSDDDLF